MLERQGFDIVYARGPLDECAMLGCVGDFDAVLCGDDALTETVLRRAQPRLKLISKYGVGVDRIDFEAARRFGMTVANCAGVNAVTVAEQVMGLMLAGARNIVLQADYVAHGQWRRMTGHDLAGKTLGIVGLGRVGLEVAIRAGAFGMHLLGFDPHWPRAFADRHGIRRAEPISALWRAAGIVSLNCALNEETRKMINADAISQMRRGVMIVNCARGGLVDSKAMRQALESGAVGLYAADVLDEEPPAPNHVLLNASNCMVTPHIASRTYENIERQAVMAVDNLLWIGNSIALSDLSSGKQYPMAVCLARLVHCFLWF